MPIYEYLDSFAFIIIVKFEFSFNIDDYYILGWAVQSSTFRVEKSAHSSYQMDPVFIIVRNLFHPMGYAGYSGF